MVFVENKFLRFRQKTTFLWENEFLQFWRESAFCDFRGKCVFVVLAGKHVFGFWRENAFLREIAFLRKIAFLRFWRKNVFCGFGGKRGFAALAGKRVYAGLAIKIIFAVLAENAFYHRIND